MPATDVGASEDLLAELSAWVKLETPTTDAMAVNRLMDVAEAALTRAGAAVTRIPGRDGFGDNLVARTPPAPGADGNEPILVAGHLDTVWSHGTLDSMPYSVNGPKAHGPGIYDMKAGSFLAFHAVRCILTQKIATNRPIVLLLTPDEEVGSPTSRWLIEQEAAQAASVLIPEPAGASGACVTARRGVGRFVMRVEGRGSHSGGAFEDGASAIVELSHQIIGLHSGVIQDVLVEKSEAPLPPEKLDLLDIAPLSSSARPTSALMSSRVTRLVPAAPESEHTLTAISGSNFVMRTEEGDVLLPVAQVRSILVKDMKTTIAKTLATSKKTKRLSFKFDGAEKKQAVAIMYFRPGIRWIPTYRVLLNDKQEKKTATVALQAELLNEAEDLNDVPVDIVVGVPNFRFRGNPSPLVLEATLRNALAEAAPDLMNNQGQSLSNSMYSQRSAEFRRDQAQANAAAQGVVDLPNELTAGGAQDLFVYNLPKLTLGKSERMAVPIFSTEVPYRDLYTWEVHITKHDNDAAPSGSGTKSPLVLSKNEVWHQIVLTNSTNLPWTTGAAMIMQGNQPLAQELLTYTPPKDEVRVPVTVSVDTRGSLADKEVGRDLKSLQWEGYNYARIDKEMKLDLCNNKAIAIEAEVTLRVGGKVDKASLDGDVILNPFDATDWVQYNGQPAVNNSSSVTWKTKLKPGEKFEPSVLYHYFTRN